MSEHFLTDFGDTVSIGKAGEQRQNTFFGNDRSGKNNKATKYQASKWDIEGT